MKKEHPLHRKIGISLEALEEPLEVVLDPACSSSNSQHIPLFMYEPKSRENQICNVDAIVIEGNRVHTVIEIEETSILPTKICGKILTSAFAQFYEHKNHANRCILSNSKFIQIVNDKSLKLKSKKRNQAKNIQKKIDGMLKNFTTISEYHFFWASDLDDTCSKIIDIIQPRTVPGSK